LGGKGSGQHPQETPEVVDRVRQLYHEQGLTTPQIATALSRSQNYIWKLMRRNGIVARTNGRLAAAPPRFQGTDAEYQAHHKRVKEQRGMPQRCETCGTDDPSVRYEWANMTGRYDDPSDYRRLCKRCHHWYDGPRRGPPELKALPAPEKIGAPEKSPGLLTKFGASS
jgi:hypothetical protein